MGSRTSAIGPRALGVALLSLAGCGGAEASAPELFVVPACWRAAAEAPDDLREASRGLLGAFRWGQGLDALDRMLAPYVAAPDRAAWSLRERGAGFDVLRTGARRPGGALQLSLEVVDRDEAVTVEAWQATAWPGRDGWAFDLAGASGSSSAEYVRWGDRRRGCGEGLAFSASGGELRCWWSEDDAPAPEVRCRALEAQLAAKG